MPNQYPEFTDSQFLQWIHDRLRLVHQTDPNVDYMHRLRKVIASVELAEKKAATVEEVKWG